MKSVCNSTPSLTSIDIEKVDETAKGWRPSHQTSSSQEVKQLTEEDIGNYTIHDVIMPLPGWNIDYPAGDIGELYTKILKEDGLDPKRMQRDQRYVMCLLLYILLFRIFIASFPHRNYTIHRLDLAHHVAIPLSCLYVVYRKIIR